MVQQTALHILDLIRHRMIILLDDLMKENYNKAFEYKYFAGKFLPDYLREFLAVMKKTKAKKTDYNPIVDFAHAVQYSINNDNMKYQKWNRNIDCDFENVFPKDAFFKEL